MERIYQKHDTQHVAATVVYADRSGMLFADSDYTVSFNPYDENKVSYELLIEAYMNGTLVIAWNNDGGISMVRPCNMSVLDHSVCFDAVVNGEGSVTKQFVTEGK